jgi:hypothetical protein
MKVMKRVRDRSHIDILALGGSITAGGYFLEFARSLREKNNLTTTVHNHGHGATEITCKKTYMYTYIYVYICMYICIYIMAMEPQK